MTEHVGGDHMVGECQMLVYRSPREPTVGESVQDPHADTWRPNAQLFAVPVKRHREQSGSVSEVVADDVHDHMRGGGRS